MYIVELARVGEPEQLAEYDPWPMDTLPRAGEVVWTAVDSRYRVREVIHAPYERRVTLMVTDSPPEDGEGVDGGDGDE